MKYFFHALIKEVLIILGTKQFQFQLTSLVWSKKVIYRMG